MVSAPGADHLASTLSLHLQFADESFRSVVEARCSIYPVLAAEAATNATPEDIETLHESVARMRGGADDPDLFREEARRFMNLIATASGNRVLAILVEALHRMSGETSAEWDETQRRSVFRSYARVIEAIENGEPEAARSIMAKSLRAALRRWEQMDPELLKQPVAWIASDG